MYQYAVRGEADREHICQVKNSRNIFFHGQGIHHVVINLFAVHSLYQVGIDCIILFHCGKELIKIFIPVKVHFLSVIFLMEQAYVKLPALKVHEVFVQLYRPYGITFLVWIALILILGEMDGTPQVI